MNKNLIVFGIAIILLSVGLSGCSQQNSPTSENNNDVENGNEADNNQDEIDRQKFIGTWLGQDDDILRTYYSDGSKIIDGDFYGYWKVENGKLITTNTNGDIYNWDYEFYADGERMILTSEYGYSTHHIKQ